MKKLFCYLFGHSQKKSSDGKNTHARCSMCGEHFLYDEDLDHYFSEEELSTEIEEDDLKESGIFGEDKSK